MVNPATIESPPIVALHPEYCQWCGSHEARIHDLDGAWCCELHRDADRAGQKQPTPYTPGSGGDDCGRCEMPNDCTCRAPRNPSKPLLVFGGTR